MCDNDGLHQNSAFVLAGAGRDSSSEVHTGEIRSSRSIFLASICHTTFVAIAEANMDVRTAHSAKQKRRPYQHCSTISMFGAQIGKDSASMAAWLQQHTSSPRS